MNPATSTLSHTSSPESSTKRSPPWLPFELISLILTELWEAPQTLAERSALLKNITLVNRTWLALFVRVTSRSVHICNPTSAEAFLRLLPERTLMQGVSDLLTAEASKVANQMCRSVTFHVDGSASLVSGPVADRTPATQMHSPSDAASTAMSTVLYMVTVLDQLPNLRHVTIDYKDWGYDDIFDQLRVQTFPPQVTHLSVNYSFTTPALAPLLIYLKSLYRRQDSSRIRIPNVRHLSLSSVPAEFIVDMLQACPNVETLEVTDPARLDALAPLPSSVRTLILRHPSVPLSRSQMISGRVHRVAAELQALQC
ncbi:hypothetical protein BD309DRAFT_997033 [Dichomitus squalens]|uniref:Uncharacterized protein n=1 Tax=Dichomitus squalens TaxID=114155 RepID=A0A4V2K5P8_9APHY|nr:hypothetical protein BD311DRAFT_787028 [Dichomitus squalens]TBU49173.1 hypothetical protein BD309DRAFT_997033 [Dichomitus squalens]